MRAICRSGIYWRRTQFCCNMLLKIWIVGLVLLVIPLNSHIRLFFWSWFEKGDIGTYSISRTLRVRIAINCSNSRYLSGIGVFHNTGKKRKIILNLFQVIKSAFPKGYTGMIFIKGFYKDHNDIFFLGFSLEIEHETYQSLVNQSDYNWEKLYILSLFEDPQEVIALLIGSPVFRQRMRSTLPINIML